MGLGWGGIETDSREFVMLERSEASGGGVDLNLVTLFHSPFGGKGEKKMDFPWVG